MLKTLIDMFDKIKKNQRYVWVFLVIILVFLINKVFPAEIITSESCMEGKCKTVIENASLTDEVLSFFVNDVFKSKPDEYYRLNFQARSNRETTITLYATNLQEQEEKIESFIIKNTNTDLIKQVIFKSGGEYTDLLFVKNILNDGADVFIDRIGLSKLNVNSDSDVANLTPSIIGSADMGIEDQAQENSKDTFNQLRDPGIILGQIFIPKMNYITGVSLDIDIIKQDSNGGKKYALELREVDMEDDIPNIKSDPLATLDFSVIDLEKYRQENGKFLFPILARIEPDKSYFIGINNDKLKVNEFNYLILKGSKNKDSYQNGQVAIKHKSQSYLAPGNLYFKTYGFEIKKYNGVNILPGSMIEDLGNGKTQFSYKSLSSSYELTNIYSKKGDIYFDRDNKSLVGKISEKDNPYYVYKFETIFPFSSFSIKGITANPAWNDINISYSFDNNNWQTIQDPYFKKFEDEKKDREFNIEIQENNPENNIIYIKIEPLKDKYPEQSKFGLDDFEFKANLIIPNK